MNVMKFWDAKGNEYRVKVTQCKAPILGYAPKHAPTRREAIAHAPRGGLSRRRPKPQRAPGNAPFVGGLIQSLSSGVITRPQLILPPPGWPFPVGNPS